MTYDDYRQQCSELAKQLLGLGDILDEDDPYELLVVMKEAFDNNTDPEHFIRDVFEEDFVKQEYDKRLYQEAAEYDFEDE